MTTETQEYARGYQAGRKKGTLDAERDIKLLKQRLDERAERIYMQSLDIVLKHCGDGRWNLGGTTITNAKGYCQLAEVFANNSIQILDK